MPQTTSTTSIPPELMPYLTGFLNQGMDVYRQPYTPYGGQRVAGMSGLQQQALGGIQGMMGGSPELDQASSIYSQFGADGGMNPFTEQVAGNTMRDLTRGYQEQLGRSRGRHAMSGVFGSTGQQTGENDLTESFARGAASGLGNIYNQGFESSMGRMLGAAQGLQGINQSRLGNFTTGLAAGNVPRSYEQDLLDSLYGDFTEQRDYDRNNLGWFGNNILGRALGTGSQTTTETPGPDRTSQILGAILGVGSFF